MEWSTSLPLGVHPISGVWRWVILAFWWLSCTAGIEIDRTLKLTLIDIERDLIDSVTELFPRQMRRHHHTRQTIRHIRNIRQYLLSLDLFKSGWYLEILLCNQDQTRWPISISFGYLLDRETLPLSKVTEKSRVHQWCTFHFIVISSGTRPLVRLQNWSQPSYGWKLCPNFILQCIVRTRWELH